MPATTYMQVDPRRDHSFSIPRPDRTIALGIPNACNRCHKEKDAVWSLGHVHQWYGDHGWQKRQDFAGMIAAGREHLPAAEAGLGAILNDQTVAAVARASAATLLANYSSPSTGHALDKAMEDTSVLVRAEAIRSAGNHLIETDAYTGEARLDEKRLGRVLRALSDSSMAVRQAAAVTCLGLPADVIPPVNRKAFELAVGEYRRAQEQMLDRPSSQLNLGNLALAEGSNDLAEKHFKTALRLEPNNQNALMRLAVVYDATDRMDDAVKVLTEAITFSQQAQANTPDDIDYVRMQKQYELEARFQRALVLARRPDQLSDAINDLNKVTSEDPTRDRAWYNLGLAEQSRKNLNEAESGLRRAIEIAPKVSDYRHALAVHYAQRGDKGRAMQVIDTILSQYPGNRAATELKGALTGQR
jgi:tetratricopeptide (TPR) repeat protein